MVKLALRLLAFLGASCCFGQTTTVCDGVTRTKLNSAQLLPQYSASSVTTILKGPLATRLQVTVDPKTLQVADQATQQVAAYIGLLVESYNACLLSPEEYRTRLAELNPLKAETTRLTRLLGDIKGGQIAQQHSLQLALRKYAQLSQQLAPKLAELDRKVEQIKHDVAVILAESQMEGLLQPAADPDPPSRCTAPPGMTKVFLGSDVGSFNASPFDAVILGSPVLTINIVEGGLSVDATVTGSDGRVIVQIVRNRFSVNRNNYLRREIPDKSTLVVTDQYGNQALYVRYLNPHAIRVLGIFREPPTSGAPDTWVMTVTDDKTTMSGRNMSKVTFCCNCATAAHGIYSFRLGPPPHRLRPPMEFPKP